MKKILTRFNHFKLYQNFISKEKGFTKICKALIIRVENIGVEPMTSCMPCKRSSQLS
jgi:hypothetical protein